MKPNNFIKNAVASGGQSDTILASTTQPSRHLIQIQTPGGIQYLESDLESLKSAGMLSANSDTKKPDGGSDAIEHPLETRRASMGKPEAELVYIPLQINQVARINAEFVILEEKNGDRQGRHCWKPAAQWEQPVWGWVVLNQANLGIQFFEPNGRFYREIRYYGPKGSLSSTEWLPDRVDVGGQPTPAMLQLQRLFDRLTDDAYLLEFANMVNSATCQMEPAPSAFSESSSVATGRPLALVNIGLSVDLASDNASQPGDEDFHGQEFSLKLGQKANDGFVGYWKGAANPMPGHGLDLGTLFTHYVDEALSHPSSAIRKGRITKLDDGSVIKVRPYSAHPDAMQSAEHGSQHVHDLEVFGVILDPLATMHISSSVLAVRELSLSPWMWQTSFNNITTFLHMGPLMVTHVGGQEDAEVRTERSLIFEQDAHINIPTTSPGQWDWLQPIRPQEQDVLPPFETRAHGAELFDQRAYPEGDPSTAIEGFLLVKKVEVQK